MKIFMTPSKFVTLLTELLYVLCTLYLVLHRHAVHFTQAQTMERKHHSILRHFIYMQMHQVM